MDNELLIILINFINFILFEIVPKATGCRCFRMVFSDNMFCKCWRFYTVINYTGDVDIVSKDYCFVDNYTCSVDTNVACNYTWTHQTSHKNVSSYTLRHSEFDGLSGTYICTAECQVRDVTCTVDARRLEIVPCSSRKWTCMLK